MDGKINGGLAGIAREQRDFQVSLDGVSGQAHQLSCHEVVRFVPGKRFVAAARWQGRDVYAKFYLSGARAATYWRRELRGLRALHEYGIPAPEIVHQGTAGDNDAFVVLLAAIPSARSFAERWCDRLEDEERKVLLCRLVEVIAQHHRHGLEHRDPHLSNFLVSGGTIFTLDGGAVSVSSSPLGERRSLRNLAMVLAQLRPGYERLVPDVWRAYCRGRIRHSAMPGRRRLERLIDAQRSRRRDRYLQKIFRDSTEFSCHRAMHRYVVLRRELRSEPLLRLLQDPDASLAHQDAEILKDGNTCTVWSVPVDGYGVVVKRYNIKDRPHAFSRAWRRTRAAVSWRNAHRLRFYGIATATPVALIEERRGPLRGRAYFISEAIEGPDCLHLLRENRQHPERAEALMANIAALLKLLAVSGITHGDMKGTNILFHEGKPFLVDLDAMRQTRHASLFRRRQRRDLCRFLKNWSDQPDRQALMREELEKAGVPVGGE